MKKICRSTEGQQSVLVYDVMEYKAEVRVYTMKFSSSCGVEEGYGPNRAVKPNPIRAELDWIVRTSHVAYSAGGGFFIANVSTLYGTTIERPPVVCLSDERPVRPTNIFAFVAQRSTSSRISPDPPTTYNLP